MRGIGPLAIIALLLAAGGGAQATRGGDAAALRQARSEAAEAERRYRALESRARRATSDADRAQAESGALAARIEAAEADLTAAERQIAIVARLQAAQRARLAARQGPVIRLTAALQTMTRRPAALAIVQPGSVRDAVHVRSLLAATLPEIRRRTAALRAEVDQGVRLRRQSEEARLALVRGREALRQRRMELARFEAARRTQGRELAGLALAESDRALVLDEEARTLAATIGTRESQARIAERLSGLSGPILRPEGAGVGPAPNLSRIPYSLPVEGRLLTGVGEISDGGVHARGLTFETAPGIAVVAPAAGRILYAAPFRRYGNVVIIDHGQGWTTVITNVEALDARPGATIRRGARIGRTGAGAPRVTVELRHQGRPVPLAQLVAG